jgi:hypothetical protein
LWLGFALDLMVASERSFDHPLHETVRRLAHQHRIRLGKALQALREIHRIAENRNILVGTVLQLPDYCRAGIDAMRGRAKAARIPSGAR